MTPAWLPLRDVEARPRAFPPGYLMAVFVGYGDESGKQDDPESPSSAYGILVGQNECWDAFDQAWKDALRGAGIEHFHRKEFGKPNGPYAQLDEIAEQRLSQDLVAAIRSAGLAGYASAVRHQALVQFNNKTGLDLDAYALSLYACLCYICEAHQFDEIQLYLDWVENRYKKLARTKEYMASYPNIPEFGDWFEKLEIHNVAKPKPEDKLSKTPGYQAADFLAWETRKYVHTDKNDGVLVPMPWPPARRRKSLHALNEATRIRGVLWDVEILEKEHSARNGIWKA